MLLTETPITVLNKQIKYLTDFAELLQTEHDPSEEKIAGLIKECKQKMGEFENAIELLNSFKLIVPLTDDELEFSKIINMIVKNHNPELKPLENLKNP